MVRAFIGETILIAALFAFGEDFPSWVLKVAMAAAILLPIGAYITMLEERVSQG